MIGQRLVPSLLLVTALAAPAAKADLMHEETYTINFTGAGTLPTAGSFTYDQSTRTFLAFSVRWDGLIFDFKSQANDPYITQGGPPCIGGKTGGAATFALLTKCDDQAPHGQHELTMWTANAGWALPGYDEFRFLSGLYSDTEGFTGESIVLNVGYYNTPAPFQVGGIENRFSVSRVPEPSALVLLLTILLGAAFVSRKRISRTPSPNR